MGKSCMLDKIAVKPLVSLVKLTHGGIPIKHGAYGLSCVRGRVDFGFR